MLSIIIPSRNEKFLNQTIKSVLDNATGEIEIYVTLDGYDTERIEDSRVHYILLENTERGLMQKRQGINQAVAMCKGEYVMALDAHCMMAKGFDEQLIKDHQPNWIQIPRRKRLEATSWTIQDGPDQLPIDYEYWMWRAFKGKFKDHKFGELHGYKWDERTAKRKDIMVDETLTFQGSCWFMTKEWYNKMGFMQVEGYTGWGQEAEELSLMTWSNGGKVMTNKNTWYAHLHKGAKHGRMYYMSRRQRDDSIHYSYNHWIINPENRAKFAKIINHFMPIPNWPEDWENNIWMP